MQEDSSGENVQTNSTRVMCYMLQLSLGWEHCYLYFKGCVVCIGFCCCCRGVGGGLVCVCTYVCSLFLFGF